MCGSFQEHLTDEARGNFERLMLSGLRALEFLGGQGTTSLGNLVLLHRDTLLLDVKRLPGCLMLPCPCQPVFFPLPCSSLLWTRCVRLQTMRLPRRPCIRRKFPGNLRRGRSKQPRRRPFVLTAVAPPLW